MTGLLLHAALILTVVGALTSALVGAVAIARELRGGPLVNAALWAPPAVALAVLAAVLLPHALFGLPDHCLHHPDHHLHLCLLHGAPMPAPPLAAVALLGLTFASWHVARALVGLFASARSVRRLRRSGRTEGDLSVLPGSEPLAFVAGLLWPRVFVSEGVLAEPERWAAVIAHERAHARRRDPLRRWLSALAAAFHWPPVSRRLRTVLAEAQELGADQAAARALGDPLRVAEAIVDWSRTLRDSQASGELALTFGAGPIRRRVLALTTPQPTNRLSRPLQGLGALAVGVTVLALVGRAPELHHSAETLLSLFG